MDVVWPLLALAVLAVMLVVPIARRSRKPEPQVRWLPDDRSEDERLESYADQLLRELPQYSPPRRTK